MKRETLIAGGIGAAAIAALVAFLRYGGSSATDDVVTAPFIAMPRNPAPTYYPTAQGIQGASNVAASDGISPAQRILQELTKGLQVAGTTANLPTSSDCGCFF